MPDAGRVSGRVIGMKKCDGLEGFVGEGFRRSCDSVFRKFEKYFENIWK